MDILPLQDISPDAVVIWRWGFFSLNATILFTWVIMGVLTLISMVVTRNLSTGIEISRWQNLLEFMVTGIRNQIREVCQREDDYRYLPFVGTLFLFILVSNVLAIIPGYVPPTGSLSTTMALALCVLVAVPLYGIVDQGLRGYIKHYLEPTVFMLPFHIMGELSRTLALAIRLFGNIMSEAKIVAILLAVTPLFFPVIMHVLGLLTGIIQAYIFAILAMVYIASATRAQSERRQPTTDQNSEEKEQPHNHQQKGEK
ncbi:MAG: ATP synthase F0F1 subunit A [Spirochaetes bacterium DG_61]|nr:MAG: ATP synthase F0F1 subunit A [Spirochaetes bacterium DG_61]